MSATNTAGTQSPTTEKAENPIGAQGDSKPISDAAQRSEQSQTRGAGDIHSGDAGNKLGDAASKAAETAEAYASKTNMG